MSALENEAVFLSYASQDAEAAKKICDALRAAGVEVWFDQSELVGGDSWDAKIRGQISSCGLFVPLISANTQARLEGYFRLEWKLAAQRTHTMADEKTFLLPVVIDATRDAEAKVPAEFKTVQWTKLPGGETPDKFCARVKMLLGGSDVAPISDRRFESDATTNAGQRPALPRKNAVRPWSAPAIVGVGLLVAIAAFFTLRPRRSPEEIAKLIASAQTIAADVVAKSAPAAPTSPAPVPASAAAFPQNPELRRAWGLFQGNSSTEDFALAEDILKAAIARHPTDPETVVVYAWLNNSYLNRGFDTSEERHVLGRRYAERAVQLAPNEPEALAALGQFLSFREADLPRAEQLLRRAIELNPREPRFYRALGFNVLRTARPAEAVPFAEHTAELFPNDALVHYELGLHYRDAGRMAEMERAFDRCLALAPISAAMIWKSWIAGWVHGDLAGMKAWLERIPADSRLSDRAIIVRYQFAVMSQQSVELADALRALQALPGTKLRDFYYTGPKALLIGDVYAAQGKRELAKGQYEVALAEIAREKTSTPADFNVLTAEIWTLIGLGRRDEALASLRLLINSTPWDFQQRFVRWWFDVMPACLLLGARDLALEQFKQLGVNEALRDQLRTAIRIDPRMAPFRNDPEIAAIMAESKKGTAAPVVVPAKADEKSVAVLAFADLSAAHDSEYFSDGISEELLNVLAKVPGLKVSARTSAFSFKGKNVPIPEIAKQLGVAYVIEGSVRKSGSQVRITAQLIKAADGFHVWSDTFTRELKDVFAVQDEIAGLIAQNLQLTLRTNSRPRTVNPAAYELLLKGRAFFARGVPAEYPQGIKWLNESLAIDPEFAATWGRLSMGYSVAFAQYVPDWLPRDEILRLARQAAARAIELDPEQSLGHYAQGLIAYLADWDWARADASMQRVLALTPGDAESLAMAASLAMTAGQTVRALDMGRRAVALDPLNFGPAYQLMKALWQSRDYLELEKESKRVIAILPQSPYGHTLLSYSLVLQGRAADGVQAAERVTSDAYRLTSLALAHYALGKTAEATAELEQLKKQFGTTSAYQVAENYAFRKDRDRAFEWLDAAYRERDAGLTMITNDPFLENLRGDARWSAFMRKMNLPDGGTK